MLSALLLVVIAVFIGVAPTILHGRIESPPVEISPYVNAEDNQTTLYNAFIFFALLIMATILIYVILPRRRLLKLLLSIIWFVLSTGVFQFYVILYYWNNLLDEVNAVRLMWASLLFGIFTVYLIHKRRGDLLLGFLGSLAGVMFVWLLPTTTIVALLTALPIYDYLMVNKGLLGRIVQKLRDGAVNTPGRKADNPLFGFVVRLDNLSLGVGDFVVYSMALSFIAMRFLQYGRAVFIIALGLGAALIYLGLLLTVKIFLKRWGYGPALPFPILLLYPLVVFAWIA
ncbi:hypothetical protein [Pyrobaculum islandicum]|uniref:hypothetical protein n=1 Tax=Pyrobaculum islandicum TaxID=2277 RepID=UPI001FD83083|nr:hypothetical protein [Pyrobaculum islandicum]